MKINFKKKQCSSLQSRGYLCVEEHSTVWLKCRCVQGVVKCRCLQGVVKCQCIQGVVKCQCLEGVVKCRCAQGVV